MTKLYYVGFNGYDQCPENGLPKIIANWTCIKNNEMVKICCARRVIAIETKNHFKVSGVLSQTSTKSLEVLEKPSDVDTFGICDEFLIASEGNNLWTFNYRLARWVKTSVGFSNKQEESIWREEGSKIVQFSFWDDSTNVILLLSNGTVWKLSISGKLSLLFLNEVENAIDVASGLEHTLILTESGCVLSCGNGRGQLGHGDLSSVDQPGQISALEGLKMIKISAGGWHSCAVSDSGDLYVWGWNNCGQLSAFDDDEEIGLTALPVLVDVVGESDSRVVDVACGTRHTIVKLENGDLYSTGWNIYRQLGIDSTEKVSKFTMSNIKTDRKGRILCGPWYTILLEEEPTEIESKRV